MCKSILWQQILYKLKRISDFSCKASININSKGILFGNDALTPVLS